MAIIKFSAKCTVKLIKEYYASNNNCIHMYIYITYFIGCTDVSYYKNDKSQCLSKHSLCRPTIYDNSLQQKFYCSLDKKKFF